MHLVHIVRILLAVWLVVGAATAVTGLLWTCKTSSEMLKEEKP
jgi:hypothetical protein